MTVTTVAAALGAIVCFVLGVMLFVSVVMMEYQERRKHLPHGFRLVPVTDLLLGLLFAITFLGLGLSLVVEFLA